MADLTLYAESSWTSPWVFHALVALEEKELPYRLEVLPWPMSAARKRELETLSVIGKVPLLVHGATAITESLAISEYLAETFPFPTHPRLFPENLADRARARQLMGYLRTDTFALREERPTTSLLGGPRVTTPLSPKAAAAAAELVRIADRMLTGPFLVPAWNIADADLALALMRLVANADPLPARLADYAHRVWSRPSIQRFLRGGA
jgi:glutathione S-transferase